MTARKGCGWNANQWCYTGSIPGAGTERGVCIEEQENEAAGTGPGGRAWCEEYPTANEAENDAARGALYCLWGEDGSLWGAATAGDAVLIGYRFVGKELASLL